MTEPIELLRERFEEIRQARDSAEANGLSKKDLEELNNIHHKYYVSIEVLKRAIDKAFIDKGVLYKASIDFFHGQEREIRRLKTTVKRLYRENSKEKQNFLTN